MFDGFSDRSRTVMGLAYQEAQRFKHDYIGTEHILLGLTREGGGVAADVLKNLSVDLKRIRPETEKLVSPGDFVVDKETQLPFTPRAKTSLELALEESTRMKHGHVGTEHLLLGVIREQEGVAAQVLGSLDVRLDDVRAEVLKVIGTRQ